MPCYIEDFWPLISQWLSELGFKSYNISPERIILGDLENSPMLSFLLLSSKKVIYNAMKLCKIPQKKVINEMRLIFLFREIQGRDERQRCHF